MKKFELISQILFYLVGICSALLLLSYLFNYNQFREIFQNKLDIFFFFFWTLLAPSIAMSLPFCYLGAFSYFKKLHRDNKNDYDERIHEEPYLFDKTKALNFSLKTFNKIKSYF